MANGLAAFAAGLMSGGVKGYQLAREWEEQDAKEARAKEDHNLSVQSQKLALKKAQQQAADDAELRAAAGRNPVLAAIMSGPQAAQGDGSAPDQGVVTAPVTSATAQPMPLDAGDSAAGGAGQGLVAASSAVRQPVVTGQDLPAVGAGPSSPPSSPPASQAPGINAALTNLDPASSGAPSQSTVGLGAPGSMGGVPKNNILAAIRQGPQGGQDVVSQGIDALHGKNYLESVAPNVMQTLIKQGRFQEAKSFADFTASEEGRKYAGSWTKGTRALAIGDVPGALKEFEGLYNTQLPDGFSVKLTPVDGKSDAFTISQYDKDGKLVAQRQGSGQQIASAAALYLSPAEAVKHFASAQEKRAEASDITDRELKLETLRQQGQLARDDRVTDRQLRVKSQGGALTAAQQRSNAEIDAARQTVAGLSPEEVRHRTSTTTATGRENPDYDPALARYASLARRRKIGQDDEFDGASRAPAAPARQDVAARFRQDRTMSNFKLGQQTARGVEVLDGTGKLMGYYH